MAISLKPFVMKNVKLTLVKTAAVPGTPVEYQCQLSQATLTPSASTGGAALETFCENHSAGAGKATWTLDLAGFQALQAVTDFSILSYNDEGEEYDFTLNPLGGVADIANPIFEGTVVMAATPIGGTAAEYAQFTVSLVCKSKPLMVTAP